MATKTAWYSFYLLLGILRNLTYWPCRPQAQSQALSSYLEAAGQPAAQLWSTHNPARLWEL
eukprot:6046987-Amphidinium_carterae.1